jgi:hypothetical protein
MTMDHDLIIDQFSPAGDGDPHLATWYAQGHSDALGDRLLMFDNTSAPSWEILRFRPSLARESAFEAAIRQQVERLVSFQHPAFPMVRPIQELGHDDGLAVVSTFAPGPRLSEAMKKPRSVMFAVRMLRQLAPAIAALQEHGLGVAHGALTAERIVVKAEGGLMIREHMIGPALASLGMSAETLWSDFGLLTPPVQILEPRFDARSDVAQIGLVVLSLMVGRRVGPDDYPAKIDELLDGVASRCDRRSRVLFQPLRYWLQRALQLDEFMFESAREACDALAELRDESERPTDEPGPVAAALPPASESADGAGEGDWHGRPGPRLIASRRADAVDESALPRPLSVLDASSTEDEIVPLATDTGFLARPRVATAVRWAALAVAVLAIGEAAFIARLLYIRAKTPPPAPTAVVIDSPQPGANVLVDDRPAGVTPLRVDVGPQLKSIRVLPSAAPSVDSHVAEATPPIDQKDLTAKALNKTAPAGGAAISPRTGGFRLVAPIEVHVLDGERVLGSSKDGPIVASAGRHEFEFVNSAIGYRERRVVDVKAGQITPVSLSLPNGTLNINAVPWAAVWIDGTAFGETPLGNISIALGEHEIVFRHPQFGERREKTIVRADGAARVSVNLQKPADPKR